MDDTLAYNEHRNMIVKTSWRRCADQFKLDRGAQKTVDVLSESEIKLRQDSLFQYLENSTEVIQAVRHLAKQGNYSVLISDATGVAVNEYSDSAESSQYREYGLILGSVWEENILGTNGIGTCLASKQSITVSGIEHYTGQLKNFTCSAAPIYAVDGTIIGALNISRRVEENYIENFFTHSFIKEAAKQISANIFLSEFKNQNVISCSQHANISLYESKALLAFDDNGIIQGATMDCLELLDDLESHHIIGHDLKDVLPVSIENIYSSQHKFLAVNEGLFANNYVKGLRASTALDLKPAVQPLQKKSIKVQTKSISAPDLKCDKLDAFAGSDTAVQRAVEICKKLINKDIPLLLLGETGVGKDTLAKLLHGASSRANEPFVAVNCAAIPPSLMDSELFGYMPGTFTDGLKDGKKGKILASHGGTLFLDEIGDMPLSLQAHLLRVLEEREVTPLGAVEPIPVDIRVVCATHKNVSELVEQGLFRQDLLYRIKGAEILLSPLRDRSNISEIIKVIINSQSEFSFDELQISEEVWNIFESYSWPGNIRELKSVLRYAMCFCTDMKITLIDLPAELVTNSRKETSGGFDTPILQVDGQMETPSFSLQHSNSMAEAQLIQNLLQQNSWNITATAEKLGISRSTLHRKIQKYEIVAPNKK